MNIIFFSDTLKTIDDYRTELIRDLSNKNFIVKKIWIKNIYLNFITILISKLIISSNIRANLINLLFFNLKPKIIILNGLGRLRKNFFLRTFLLNLFRFNKKKILIFVQNYRDYRWLRRNNIYSVHVNGSGGRNNKNIKNLNLENNKWVLISRDSKIDLQIDSIGLFKKFFKPKKILVYGIKDKSFSFEDDYVSLGYVDPSEFFLKSRNFFQPDGYSEGFPHTLADAICSNCKICLPKKLWIQYGLYKYKKYMKYEDHNDFITFDTSENEFLIDNFFIDTINKIYIENIQLFLTK